MLISHSLMKRDISRIMYRYFLLIKNNISNIKLNQELIKIYPKAKMKSNFPKSIKSILFQRKKNIFLFEENFGNRTRHFHGLNNFFNN